MSERQQKIDLIEKLLLELMQDVPYLKTERDAILYYEELVPHFDFSKVYPSEDY